MLVYRGFFWLIEMHHKYCRKERSMSPEKNAPKDIRMISITELTPRSVASAPVPVRIVPRMPSSRQRDVIAAQYFFPGGEIK